MAVCIGGVGKHKVAHQSTPLTLSEGLLKLDELKGKLGRSQLRARQGAFMSAETFARRAALAGGVTAPVSRNWPVGSSVRVDLEVIKGRAFVPD